MIAARVPRGRSHLLLAAVVLFGTAAHAATVTVEARVSASSDDAEQKVGSTSTSLTSSDLELVTDGSTIQTVGMRFTGLAIPPRVPIVAAWVQFQVDEISTDVASLTLRGQAADDAPTFTSAANDVSSRPLTAASVGWAPAAWPTIDVAGPDQRTPALAPVIQEVVNRPGWESGHALVLVVTGSGRRTAKAFDGSTSGAPLLHVEYDATGIDQAPSVTLTTPGDHAMFSAGDAIVFSGSASDPEDGGLTASLAWSSNRDGPIGFGGAFTTSSLSVGVHTVTAKVTDSHGHLVSSSRQIEIASGRHVLVGAGDIASCTRSSDDATAALLDNVFGTVITLGDNAYPHGAALDFQNCYGPGWGRHRARTRPATGNHEYETAGAAGYFGYFGAAAGNPANGLYSYDVAGWHVVVLNSECSKIGGCTRTSPQGQWLAADLAAHPTTCTLAIMHKPRFSSGSIGDNIDMADLWQILYEAGADVVLSGHDHGYERFDPQSPTGVADPKGLRLLIVGTGGNGLGAVTSTKPNSVIANGATYGVLKLTLWPASYDWQFLPVPGSSFSDSGSAACVSAAAPNGIPSVTISAPANGASFPVNTAIQFTGSASDPEDGNLTGALVWSSDRDGTIGLGGSFVTSALSAGTHVITARATDSAGGIGQSQRSITLTVAGTGSFQGRVAASADDVEERVLDGHVSLGSSDLELVTDGTAVQTVGMRFTGVSVPHGASILSASLQFKVDEASTAATSLTLQAEAADNAAPFTNATHGVSGRARTTASVVWSPPGWPTVGAQGADQRSPNLAGVIQQVVDRPGWVSGNSLVLVVTGSGKRVAKSFDGEAAGAPLLVIDYATP